MAGSSMPDPAPVTPSRPAPTARRGRRGLRRATSQAGLVAALLAVFTVCATAAGTCGLLLTAGNDRALSAAVAQADGHESTSSPDVTRVYVNANTMNGVARPNAATLVPVMRQALAEAAAPYKAEVSLWTATPMLLLPGSDVRYGYLLDADTIAANASMRSGAWPTVTKTARGTIPVAISSTTAAALGATVGTELPLYEDRYDGRTLPPAFDLVVTGIFDPSGSPAWSRDVLDGRGFVPDYLRFPTYGPFVVAPGALEALAAPVDRVAAVIDPDLAGDAAGIPTLNHGLDGVAERIKDAAGPSINPVVVWSPLGAAFDAIRAELDLSNSLVLAVFLVVLGLGGATATLVARVLVGRRSGEGTLLRDRGASAAQLVLSASIESLLVAAVALLLAAPLALALYAVTAPATLVPPATTGLSPHSLLVLIAALLAGVALPAGIVVITARPERPRRGRQVVSGPLARSGVDVMLAVVAIVTYLQLRTHVVSGTIDPLLVVAPMTCMLAMTALTTRLVPLAARAADAAAGRSRGIVLPTAGWHFSRGGAAQGAFLLVLATAVGTFGVTFLGTWSVSQADQAAAMVGADMVVAQSGGPTTARELSDATGGTATPVVDRAIVLGSRPGGVKIVALDSALADTVLRGRLPDGAAWSSAMAGLAPQASGSPVTIGGGPLRLILTGALRPSSVPAGRVVPVVAATPTIVLMDDAGSETTLVGEEVALDGRPHLTSLPLLGQQALPAGSWRVVAMDLLLVDHSTDDLITWGNDSAILNVSVAIDGGSSGDGAWDATSDSGVGGVRPAEATVHGGRVDASFSYSVLGLSWQDAHLTLLSFPASTKVPVAMTEGLAKELGLAPGDRISMTWGTAKVEVVLVRTLPYVPSHVREAALLADATSLERAVLSAGIVEPVTDAWWVGSPRPGAAEALRSAGSGLVSTRAETTTTLRDGPLRAPLLIAWMLAVAAAVGLAVAGSAVQAAAEGQRRASTIARLRAIGVSKRQALASHLIQHAATTAMAVVTGTISGAVLAWLMAPLLVVSSRGLRAVPPPALVWSVPQTAAVVGAILVGGLLAGVPAAIAVVRRSTVAALRAGDAP